MGPVVWRVTPAPHVARGGAIGAELFVYQKQRKTPLVIKRTKNNITKNNNKQRNNQGCPPLRAMRIAGVRATFTINQC